MRNKCSCYIISELWIKFSIGYDNYYHNNFKLLTVCVWASINKIYVVWNNYGVEMHKKVGGVIKQ